MSVTEEIHVGDEGVTLLVTLLDNETAVNISTATTKQLILQKPDCTILTVTASFYTDGTDGILSYSTVAGDLDIAGVWRIQGYIITPSGKYHSSKETFTVFENLE